MTAAHQTWRQLRDYALRLPEAYEDFPWNESVAKVGKKVFVFLGVEDSEEYPPGIGVKLRDSCDQALGVEGVAPMGYGLGRAGWVTVPLTVGALPPIEVLQDWIEESYRIVAPKGLAARLDQQVRD